MKLLIYILFIIVLSLRYDRCEQVSIVTFTHSDYDQLTIYKPVNGDTLRDIQPDEEAGWITKVTSSKGVYFQVYIEDLKLKGWVKKGNLSLNTRNYDGQKIA